jgi:FkbM family methyltransferase
MKGGWIPYLFRRVADQSLTPSEALRFVAWRIVGKPSPLRIEGLLFPGMDRTLWGLISNIFVNREYTPSGFDIAPHDAILDIGAHWGVFVGFASRRTDNTITAIEPDPRNFEHLERFVADNGLRNVELRRVAVGVRTGEIALYEAKSSSRHSTTGKDQLTGETLRESARVQAISLDDLLAGLRAVDMLKMDCEGAEIPVLLAASPRTMRKIRRLVAEVHWIGRQESVERLLKRLADYYGNVKFVRTSRQLGLLYASQPRQT